MQTPEQTAIPSNFLDSLKKPGAGKRLALGMLPFSPVSFTGPDALIAWGRLAGYSAIAYYTFSKRRPLSYIAMSCAGLSLASSLTTGFFNKEGGK